jgi:response regulator RpfG family c-di-GMP phosphodiesterase
MQKKLIDKDAKNNEGYRIRADLFVSNLVACNFNEVKAYSKVFPNCRTPNVNVNKYIKKPFIQKLIAKKLKELCKKNNTTSDDVIKEVTNVAMSDIKNYIEIKEDKTHVKTLEEMGDFSRCIKNIRITERIISQEETSKVIERNITLEFYDKLKALELLLKRMGEIKDTTVILNANEIQALNIGQVSNNYFSLLGR